MRILIGSDFHGLPSAYERFAETLRHYDVGILAGDNLDEYITETKLIAMLNLDPDEFLDELPGESDTAEDSIRRWQEGKQNEYLRQGLLLKEKALKDTLNAASKPVLVIPGNHDRTPWETNGNVINIHLRSVLIGGQKFVGYGCLDGGLEAELQMRRLGEIEESIDDRTILITHFPPYNLLDHDDQGTAGFGSKTLASLVAEKHPRCHIFGHTHSAFGAQGVFINASYPNIRKFFALDTGRSKVWMVGTKGILGRIWSR
jgi:Icc-related predicted phosphoesterase